MKSLLPLWEKGFRDEGKSFVSQSGVRHNGSIRLIIGDAYLLSFPVVSSALAGIESLKEKWEEFIKHYQIPCPISVGIHQGTMYLFRSVAYGQDMAITSRIESTNSRLTAVRESSISVSEKIQAEVVGTAWEHKLHKLEGGSFVDSYGIEHTLYQLRK